jgi:hypothetical protein
MLQAMATTQPRQPHRCLVSVLSQIGSGSDTSTGIDSSLASSEEPPSSCTGAPPVDMLANLKRSLAMPLEALARDTWGRVGGGGVEGEQEQG